MRSYAARKTFDENIQREPVQGLQSEYVPSPYAEALHLYFHSLSENELSSNPSP